MSPLEARFAARGVAFASLPGGARVPARFGDPAKEHRATREACALFDFSFMGGWEIGGPGAGEALARLQTRALETLVPGQAAYTLLLREDGTVLNDATAWKLAADRWWLFTGRPADGEWIAGHARAAGASVAARPPTAILALQGPASGAVLAALAGSAAVRALGWFRFAAIELPGGPAIVARLGYTGELGYEILVDAARGPAMWQALVAAGAAFGLAEAGFEAADSLRIECGHLLFLRELARPRRPSEIGLARLFTSTHEGLVGGAAARAASGEPGTRLVGVASLAGEAPPESPALELTSEAVSPAYPGTIGLGFAPPAHDRPGTRLRAADGRAFVVTALDRHDPSRRRARADPLPP